LFSNSTKSRFHDIGWFLTEMEGGHVFFSPKSAANSAPTAISSKAVQSCPAILDQQSRNFEVHCPFDLQLRLKKVSPNKWDVFTIKSGTSIQSGLLRNLLKQMPASERRTENIPVIQISTPYVFVSNEITYINQRHPSGASNAFNSWQLISGRFPIHSWVRPISWAVEWVDVEQDIVLTRGQPWFSVDFEAYDPRKKLRLRQVEMSAEAKRQLLGAKNVASMVRGTTSLFDTALRRMRSPLIERYID
jgi:predicted RNA binding protein YcfA (HicA-like mRNA interferase family)